VADTERSGSVKGRRHALTVLRHRNFRLIWFGQVTSAIGQQMQQVAIAWHLFVLTDSTLKVGLVGIFGLIPFIGMSLVGGALADRFDRKRILIVTQLTSMALSGCLLAATLTDVVTPGLIYVYAFTAGLTRAFDAPARQSMIPNLVPRDELASALTLNTMFRQVATVIGPGLGGIVVGVFGVSAAYAINVVSFLALIGALLVMDPIPSLRRSASGGLALALGGFDFVRRDKLVLSVLSMDFLVTALGSLRPLLPVFARDILDMGPGGFGLLSAAPAAGALTGTLILGAMAEGWRRPSVILVSSALFGLCTLGFGLSTVVPLSLILLFGTGLTDVVGEVLRSTLVQLRTPDELRGRVTALNTVFATGGPQLGQLTSGALGSAIGAADAAVAAGGMVLLVVGLFSFNPQLRSRDLPPDVRPIPVEPQPT
jgi:MFS family permease